MTKISEFRTPPPPPVTRTRAPDAAHLVKVDRQPASIFRPFPDLFGGGDTHATYKGQLRGMNDDRLGAEAKRLESVIADASTGPSQNAGAAARARAQLAEVKEEQAARAGFASSANPGYSREVHGMSDKQLATERARQVERYHEATTGLDRDPAKAADAKAKLDILSKEQGARFRDQLQGALPKATPTRPLNFFNEIAYHAKAATMSDAQIAQERGKLYAELRDATTGAHRDPVEAENCRKKLSILDHVSQARHPQSKPITEAELSKYQAQARNMSDGQLSREKTRLGEAIKNWQADPVGAANARRQLGVVDQEVSTRASHRAQFKEQVSGMSDEQLQGAAAQRERALRWFGRDNPAMRNTLEELRTIRQEQLHRLTGGPVLGPPAEVNNPAEKLDDRELVADLLKAGERYTEATTGLDTDPARAQEAAKQIQRDIAELLKRLFKAALGG